MEYYFLKKFNICVRFGHASDIYSQVISVKSYMLYYQSIVPCKYLQSLLLLTIIDQASS